MLTLARANLLKAGVTNVEFLKGEIEHIPLTNNPFKYCMRCKFEHATFHKVH